MSRAAVYNLVNTDTTIAPMVSEVYAFGSIDTPETLSEAFIVIRWGGANPGAVKRRGPVQVTFWVYDKMADYTNINLIIERLKTIMLAATHLAGADGWTLSMAEWSGESEDLYDDVYGCIVRTVTFTVVTRPS